MKALEKNCGLFANNLLEKQKKEYFNDFGYNYSKMDREVNSHYLEYSRSKLNVAKRKPKI